MAYHVYVTDEYGETHWLDCLEAPDAEITLADPRQGAPDLLWKGIAVARLAAGPSRLRPRVNVLRSELVDTDQERRIGQRLEAWCQVRIEALLGPLIADPETLPAGPARGLLFRLGEHLGSMPRALVTNEIAALDKDARRALRAIGVRIGRESIFAPQALKTHAVTLRGILHALEKGTSFPLALPADGRASLPVTKDTDLDFLEAVGYRGVGPIAIRVEILERVATDAWALSEKGPFDEPATLMNLLGCGAEDLAKVLARLGYQRETVDGAVRYRPKRREAGRTGRPPAPPRKAAPKSGKKPKSKAASGEHPDKRRRPVTKQEPAYDPHSPFAKLRELKLGSGGRS
ncbi:MAG: hypothetical protein VW338_18545 [Rhodospirillaceae bacterium]